MYFKVLCFMTALFATSSGFAEKNQPKICVVGAGIAGLTCAYRLHQKGLDVDLYEARHRVGGRILSCYTQGHVAELGGQFISDGDEAENLHRLIKEFDLEVKESFANFQVRLFGGKDVLDIEERALDKDDLKSHLIELAKTSKNMREMLDSILERDDPLYRFIAVMLAGYEGASVDKLSSCYTETLYHLLLGGISSAYPAEDRLLLSTIKGGNSTLCEKIASQLGPKIHLGMPVTKVTKDPEGRYLLAFKNGQSAQADILVLAMPCSVYDSIDFDTSVIDEKRLADIRSIPYGENTKILVPFKKAPPNRCAYANDYMSAFFDQDLTVLTLYYNGKKSTFSEKTVQETYHADRPMLQTCFKDACPAYADPVYAQDAAFVSYDGPVGYSWLNDPYAKGSYSYIGIGQEPLMINIHEEEGELVKSLFSPINNSLFFAGEHTSILLDVLGTMEAACESGERTARMVAKKL